MSEAATAFLRPTSAAQSVAPRHFVVIGAQKSGTTGLYKILSRHPDIAMSHEKETNYFARPRRDESPEGYRAEFPANTGARWFGEASPVYTMEHEYPGVAARMHRALPDARLIYIVRDPYKRALSQYQHDYLSGQVRMEGGRVSQENLDKCVETSRYHRQLSAYLAHYPLRDVLILEFEQLVSDQNAIVAAVRGFLDLPPLEAGVEEERAHNTSDQRGQVPLFILRRWNSPVFKLARRYLPDDLRQSARNVYRLFPKRVAPPLDEASKAWIREALVEDVAEFRRLTGRAFATWSI